MGEILTVFLYNWFMISLQLELFILIGIGFILSKTGHFPATARKHMTDIVLYLVLPCATIMSFEIDVDQDLVQSMFWVLIISTLIQFLSSILSKICWKNIYDDRRPNLQYGTMVSNAGFMGMPVSQSAYGSLGLLYASIFLIPQRISMWSYGLSLYTKGDRKEVFKKVATNPCVVAIYIGVLLMFLGMMDITLPSFLDTAIHAVAQCNTALSMIVIGGILSEVPKEKLLDKISFAYSFLRLVFLPLLVLVILLMLDADPMVRNVCVLLSGMPAAGTTAMLAQQYEKDPEFASKIIFVSTLLSMITLPILFILLESV